MYQEEYNNNLWGNQPYGFMPQYGFPPQGNPGIMPGTVPNVMDYFGNAGMQTGMPQGYYMPDNYGDVTMY